MNSIFSKAQNLKSWCIKHRRHLHQYPEISLHEKNTAAYCTKIFHELGYDVKPSWGYGFTAELAGGHTAKTVALRADMDALPIEEKNTHDFISKHSGIAHMCGHDTHMSIALCAAKLLSELQEQLPCNVRFIFQPSEEKPPGGAPGMIANGCLAGVSEIFGLHNDPGTELGKIRTRIGPLMAAADHFELTINGRGCHAARPHDGLDPIYPAAQLINQWQSIISRRINPNHPAVLSVTKINAGNTFNVIPDKAYFAGTIRTFDEADRKLIPSLMQQTLLPLYQHGYECQFNHIKGYDAVINHKEGVQRISAAAKAIIGEQNVDSNTSAEGWAEDFAYYLQHCPGAFFFLGSGNSELGISAPLHSSHFDIDENALIVGAAIMVELVLQAKQ